MNVTVFQQHLNHHRPGVQDQKTLTYDNRMQAQGNKVAWESSCFSDFALRWFLSTSVQIRCHYWADKPAPKGWTWMGCLNKCNNGFYCHAGSNSPTHPWQGAQLSVEQPVSKHKVDLADYELERCSYWDMASLSLSFSATPPCSQLCWMER